ncbi:MAG: selenocysteine-specific translation elongation factor [Bryobacteraceae bacterium]
MSNGLDGRGGIVFGTAGHIDHGKTTLVRSLTGIDTDRLAEEKKRGLSIELGFADLVLPNDRRIAIVDVPGHERFIKNMLAGVGGLDAVLLVIAADEGIKPQTREHFDICRLLNISRGIIVLTKADLVRPERIEQLESEARDFCRNSFLDRAPCIPVSAREGSGLPRLIGEMTSLVDGLEPRREPSFARLPIDRSFKMQGFGTVVTGTLQGGCLRVGDTVEIHPLREHYRIRGIQVHRQPVEEAWPGQRTAINLAGIEAQQIHRGAVLTVPDTFESTKIFDAAIQWLDPKCAIRTRQSLRLYVGSLETTADVRLIEALNQSQSITRIASHEPLLILPQDRFVLRNADATVGGGAVLDPFPPIRINREKTSVRLRALLTGSDGIRIRTLVEESTQGRKISNLVRTTGWTPERIKELAKADGTLTICETEQRVVGLKWLEQKRQQVIAWLQNFHQLNPASKGAAMHQVRSSLMSGIEPTLSDLILRGSSQIVIAGDTVSLLGHVAKVSPEETAARATLEQLFQNSGFQPPSADEALAAINIEPKRARIQLDALLKEKRLVKVASDLILHVDVVEQMKRSIALRKGQRFSVPEFKVWTNVSRKYAIPLLEFLDRERVTRREGDIRVVL